MNRTLWEAKENNAQCNIPCQWHCVPGATDPDDHTAYFASSIYPAPAVVGNMKFVPVAPLSYRCRKDSSGFPTGIFQNQLLSFDKFPRLLLSSTDSRIYSATDKRGNRKAALRAVLCFLLFLAISTTILSHLYRRNQTRASAFSYSS